MTQSNRAQPSFNYDISWVLFGYQMELTLLFVEMISETLHKFQMIQSKRGANGGTDVAKNFPSDNPLVILNSALIEILKLIKSNQVPATSRLRVELESSRILLYSNSYQI